MQPRVTAADATAGSHEWNVAFAITPLAFASRTKAIAQTPCSVRSVRSCFFLILVVLGCPVSSDGTTPLRTDGSASTTWRTRAIKFQPEVGSCSAGSDRLRVHPLAGRSCPLSSITVTCWSPSLAPARAGTEGAALCLRAEEA